MIRRNSNNDILSVVSHRVPPGGSVVVHLQFRVRAVVSQVYIRCREKIRDEDRQHSDVARSLSVFLFLPFPPPRFLSLSRFIFLIVVSLPFSPSILSPRENLTFKLITQLLPPAARRATLSAVRSFSSRFPLSLLPLASPLRPNSLYPAFSRH